MSVVPSERASIPAFTPPTDKPPITGILLGTVRWARASIEKPDGDAVVFPSIKINLVCKVLPNIESKSEARKPDINTIIK